MIYGTEKEYIRHTLIKAGAVEAGFAEAAPVEEKFMHLYTSWIEEGCHSGMDYLRRHIPLKAHPRHVLEGAATVISTAFSYAPAEFRAPALPSIACYAYGSDYHDVLRRRLSPAVEEFKTRLGGEWRICIDSAPLAERYWALKCGIGINGKNGSVITKKSGGYIFLAEILTTLSVAPDKPSKEGCKECGACVKACPQSALRPDGTVDSRRCLNYLTIEHRGPWAAAEAEAMLTDAARRSLFGCDICLRVCPHNRDAAPADIPEFQMRDSIRSLDAARVAAMTQPEFSAIFKGSPIKRAKLDGLRRNALNIIGISPDFC
jgi:epoxyqueuosine reductase